MLKLRLRLAPNIPSSGINARQAAITSLNNAAKPEATRTDVSGIDGKGIIYDERHGHEAGGTIHVTDLNVPKDSDLYTTLTNHLPQTKNGAGNVGYNTAGDIEKFKIIQTTDGYVVIDNANKNETYDSSEAVMLFDKNGNLQKTADGKDSTSLKLEDGKGFS